MRQRKEAANGGCVGFRQVTAVGNWGLMLLEPWAAVESPHHTRLSHLSWGRSPGVTRRSQQSPFGASVTWPASKHRYSGLRQPEKVPRKSGGEHSEAETQGVVSQRRVPSTESQPCHPHSLCLCLAPSSAGPQAPCGQASPLSVVYSQGPAQYLAHRHI